MAVRIRLKKMGRKARPFFRFCAVDARAPRDGRVIEELGIYDPMVRETDARVKLKTERVDYWLGVGAQPSQKAGVLIKKYGSKGTHLEQQQAAQERMKTRPAFTPPPSEVAAPVAEANAEAPVAEEAPTPEVAAEAAPASGEGESPKPEAPASEAPGAQ